MITDKADKSLNPARLEREMAAFRAQVSAAPQWYFREKYVDRGVLDPFYILDFRQEVEEPGDDLLDEPLFATRSAALKVKRLTRERSGESQDYWQPIASGDLVKRLERLMSMYREDYLQPPGILDGLHEPELQHLRFEENQQPPGPYGNPQEPTRQHPRFEEKRFLFRLGTPKKNLIGVGPKMYTRRGSVGALRGRVTDDRGAPLVGVTVELFSAPLTYRRKTQDGGMFWFSRLLPGSYRFRVEDRTCAARMVDEEEFSNTTFIGEICQFFEVKRDLGAYEDYHVKKGAPSDGTQYRGESTKQAYQLHPGDLLKVTGIRRRITKGFKTFKPDEIVTGKVISHSGNYISDSRDYYFWIIYEGVIKTYRFAPFSTTAEIKISALKTTFLKAQARQTGGKEPPSRHVLSKDARAIAASSPHPIIPGFKIKGPWDSFAPVHEVFTLLTIREAINRSKSRGNLLKNIEDRVLPKWSSRDAHKLEPKDLDRSVQQFTRGVIWPDDPRGLLFDNPATTTDYSSGALWSKEFFYGDVNAKENLIARSHHGDLQFFHAMASDNDIPAAITLHKILNWAAFLSAVAIGEISHDQKLGELKPDRDDEETLKCDPFCIHHLFPAHLNWTISELFLWKDATHIAIRQRAAGALLHLIQDSFSKSHTKRPAEARVKYPNEAAPARPIQQFYCYKDQEGHGEHDKWPEGNLRLIERVNKLEAMAAVAHGAWLLMCLDTDKAEGRKETLRNIQTKLRDKVFNLDEATLNSGPGELGNDEESSNGT